jgi:hypothetical protein
MYKVVDHISGDKKRFDTFYEAADQALKLARIQTLFSDSRVHVSVMDGHRQAIEINIRQREEVR